MAIVSRRSLSVGTPTNDDAPAGYVGEYQSFTATGVVLTTATPLSVLTVPLPSGGDWVVEGSVAFQVAASANISDAQVSSNTVTNTIPANPDPSRQRVAGISSTANVQLSVGRKRYSVTGGTNVYIVVQATFTVGTLAASVFGSYRRVR